MIENLIDIIFYIILCSSYLLMTIIIALFIQLIVYQLSNHKINLYKIIYKQFKKLI